LSSSGSCRFQTWEGWAKGSTKKVEICARQKKFRDVEKEDRTECELANVNNGNMSGGIEVWG